MTSRTRREKPPYQSFLEGLGPFFPKKGPNVPLANLIGVLSLWRAYEKPPFQKFFGGFGILFFKKGSQRSPLQTSLGG